MSLRGPWVERGVKNHIDVRKKWDGWGVRGLIGAVELAAQAR